MQITFGKYDGETSQEVVVKHASYAKWVLDQAASGSLGALQAELKRLVANLDKKLYTCACSTRGCARPVTRLTDVRQQRCWSLCLVCGLRSL